MFEKLKQALSGGRHIDLGSPVQGQAVPVSEVNDPTFSDDILGKGVAVKPAAGRVVAPSAGTVTQMFETGHACTLLLDDGIELLIHIGLDTIKLKGEHFTKHAADGDKVQAGDLLMEFDRDAIAAAGYDTIVPVIVCNPQDFSSIEMVTGKTVNELEKLIDLDKK